MIRLPLGGFCPFLLLGLVLAGPGCAPDSPQPTDKDVSSTAEPTMPSEPASSPAKESSISVPSDLQPPKQWVAKAKPADAIEIRSEAKKIGQHLVQAYPEKVDTFEVKARIHLLIGENDAAEKAWNAALHLNPEFAFALYGLGKVNLLRGDAEKAITHLGQAAEKLPDYTYAHHDLADAYHQSGQVRLAVEVLSQFAESHPTSAETLLLLGLEQLAAQDFEAARSSFESCLELSPDQPRAQEGLGRALVRLGEREKAQKLFEQQKEARTPQAANRSPEQVFADELVEYAPKYADAAKVYLSERDWESAEAVLTKASILDPTDTAIWSTLLDLYQSTGRVALAAQLTKTMCAANPTNPSAFFTSGVIHSKAGNIDAARAAFLRLIELSPNAPEGYSFLARLALQTQTELATARPNAQRAVDLRGSASDYELLAQTFAVERNFEAAEKNLLKAIELAPDNQAYKAALKQLEQFLNSQR